ncbi:flagellar motor control protein ZomB [Corynebacterium silvaticum]|uniref:Flagellar motor control protein ZomB n=1 Tax=Corynebacterium silvaticum TaxID=2320431 RepID=A0A7Y4LJU7_9CORY|nr:flagellar motor control protein ZomB [Corynebacterium silvaticum]ARU46908.1 flagellar motor control protein ZomB [Corynebacterium silvaticum]MBH5300698.1 arabinofuranosyl transferase C [Corynebacterium silvaticum]NOM64897.1 arabinofuranosyl transferase C [Corynebacterium silvaticum]NON70222.1 arabinofuranosyl transferase C [Corynebacterium silvaticum]TFA91683.1 arabinofuranosyl transferase C [Corynebacterium silvaticum]
MNKGRSLSVTTAFVSTTAIAVIAFVGGWQRRWISDDGLIVLRTVRNLLAGNGPVFNAGERVEANTSTLWQYLIFAVAKVTGGELSAIALWLALLLTTAALTIAALATVRLHPERNALILPFGALIYIALPPARDFATSGLEWGLSLFWLAVLWWLIVAWVNAVHPPAAETHASQRTDRAFQATLFLAFWCSLSWFIRPEMALYGGVIGLVIFVNAETWRRRGLILLVALPLPLGYQIFRMGYYGLIVPQTAVAKSAKLSDWTSGWMYLRDFNDPYGMIIAALLVLAVGYTVFVHGGFFRGPWGIGAQSDAESAQRFAAMRSELRTSRVIIVVLLCCAFLHILYVTRVGGDFMHGRMLLLPLFVLLLPVAVIPIRPTSEGKLHELASFGIFCGAVTWAFLVVAGGHSYERPGSGDAQKEIGIVDEREYWTQSMGRASDNAPKTAEDFLEVPVMRTFKERLAQAQANNDALMLDFVVDDKQELYDWQPIPRDDSTKEKDIPLTITRINLGMTSMNAPLDVRVVDSVGLSNPLGARQPRIEGSRVGHNKHLPLSWQAADSAANLNHLPVWVDGPEATSVRKALYTEEIAEFIATYREPMSVSRFFKNIAFALGQGRSLELNPDPAHYGATVDPAARISWPVSARTD